MPPDFCMKKESKPEVETDAPELTPEQLAELQARAAKADENWDRLLRVTADFENFKKRAARERTEAAQFANASLLQKLIPILDNFEMAQAAAQTAQGDKLASLQTGIAMIQQQFKRIIESPCFHKFPTFQLDYVLAINETMKGAVGDSKHFTKNNDYTGYSIMLYRM